MNPEDAALNRIEQVIQEKVRIASRMLRCGSCSQNDIGADYTFCLQKNGGILELHSLATNKIRYEASGWYHFIIHKYDPANIYCFSPCDKPLGWGHVGHQSLAKLIAAKMFNPLYYVGTDVLLAGRINFDCGRIMWWDNASGHYRPSDEDVELNIPAPLRLILRKDLYNASW